MSAIGTPELLILFAIMCMGLVVVAWPAGRICQRAGFSAWLGLLAILPIANVILLWVLALTPWPALRSRT